MKTLGQSAAVGLTVLLVTGFGASLVSAGQLGQGTMPLRGFGTMHVVLTAGTIDCLAPDATVVAQFPAEFDALARYSGLGRTVGTILAENCQFDPIQGTLTVTGFALQTAADGDELDAPYVAVFQPDFSFDLEIVITGGSGRFADACGWALGGGQFDPLSGSADTWLQGWVSSPGLSPDFDVCG